MTPPDSQAEMGLPYPQVPVLFFKPPNTLADPISAIPIPKVAQDDEMDYEVELAIILGRDTKDVSEEDALGCVLGYTVANDLTARKHQTTSSQWGYAKGEPYLLYNIVLCSADRNGAGLLEGEAGDGVWVMRLIYRF